MSADLSPLLSDWPFEPGRLNARVITGDDGEPRLQIRLDLGILQMFVDGRPDGQTPYGFDSLLEYFEHKVDEAEGGEAGSENDEERSDGARRYRLTSDDCEALRDEAVQYYHRYMALLTLEDFERVVRDTTRNLRVLDLCAEHAESESDRTSLEQFRPYITMVRARALAGQALKDNEPKAAIHAIDEGLEALRQYFAESEQPEMFEQSGEVQLLRGMRDSLIPKLPVSQKAELRARLHKALEQENYELAAILRDELKQLKD